MGRGTRAAGAALGWGIVWLAAAAGAPARAQEGPASRLGEEEVEVDAATQDVIRGALRYLAAAQAPNGAWGAGADALIQHEVAMTGYTLIAMLATGNLPGEGEFARQTARGMEYLLGLVQPDGMFRLPSRSGSPYMYNHGIATVALAELYGATHNPALGRKLELLLRLIVGSQSPEGGWRYQPRPGDADISVTVMQVVALRAARNAGLAVPQDTIDHAIEYVKACQDAASGGFTYQAGQGGPGFARTAAAIYSLQVCGLYEDPMVKRGSDYLFQRRTDRSWFTYGSYYAAPAQFMIGGDTWRKWYTFIQPELMRTVVREGDKAFWREEGGGHGSVGPVFVTAVNTTILAMPWHYLPLYQR